MSNKPLSTEASIFSFLDSNEFITKLLERNLEETEHNLVLAAHLLALCYSSTGISSGGIHLQYSQQLGPVYEDFYRPTSGLHATTTKNSIIEESLHCSRTRISISNRLCRVRYTYDFRDFCKSYFEKYSKNIDMGYFMQKDIVHAKDPSLLSLKFSLRGVNRYSEEGKKQGYEQIINRNKLVKSIVEQMFLEYSLTNNTDKSSNVKRKI